MFKSLEDIAKMMTPRPYWGSSYELNDESTHLWLDRMERGGVKFSKETLSMPKEKKHIHYPLRAGKGKSGKDRLSILNTLIHHYPEKEYVIGRDDRLRYIISRGEDELFFTSNMSDERVNLIIDYYEIKRFGWAFIDGENVHVNIVELTDEQFEREKQLRIDEEERISKMSFDVVVKMQNENDFIK